jgi:uncharacterized protein (DUF2147 family)
MKRPARSLARIILLAGPFVFFAFLPCVVRADLAEPSILGVWETQENSRIRFYECGGAVCGKLVWLKHKDRRDENNPDPALRERPLLGLTLFENFRKTDRGVWGKGTIYDPVDGTLHGKRIDISLQLDGADRLKLEGCFSIFCRKREMTRYRPQVRQVPPQ